MPSVASREVALREAVCRFERAGRCPAQAWAEGRIWGLLMRGSAAPRCQWRGGREPRKARQQAKVGEVRMKHIEAAELMSHALLGEWAAEGGEAQAARR